MSVAKDKKEPNGEVPKLATESPLAEKDQQGMATERQRKLAAKALAEWQRIKEKVTGPFKK